MELEGLVQELEAQQRALTHCLVACQAERDVLRSELRALTLLVRQSPDLAVKAHAVGINILELLLFFFT